MNFLSFFRKSLFRRKVSKKKEFLIKKLLSFEETSNTLLRNVGAPGIEDATGGPLAYPVGGGAGWALKSITLMGGRHPR